MVDYNLINLIYIERDWNDKFVFFPYTAAFCKIDSYSQVKISKVFERKIVNISLPISFNICLGRSKELSHWDSSFEYQQHNVLVEK